MTNNPTNRLLYFAFGSNMLNARLCRRCPGARFRTIAAAHDHRVLFDKLSEDSSGKANLVPSRGGSRALGAIYDIPAAEVPALDAFEGPGYARRDDFRVSCLDTHGELETITYVAHKSVGGLKPFDWYLALVLAGMLERDVEPAYVQAIRAIEFDVDPEPARISRLNAVRDLAEAGYHDYTELLKRDA